MSRADGLSNAGAPHGGEFEQAVRALRPALKLHCYRILGSFHESEDAVQDTLTKAWAGLAEFEGRASLKVWLYQIATNVCLNLLKARSHRRRYLPEQIGHPSEGMPSRAVQPDFPWLQPYPEAEIEAVVDPAPGPLARYEARESVKLAFVAAMQLLPVRQRVALLFIDVMGWTVADVAPVLGASAASINSAVQRARATMRTQGSVGSGISTEPGKLRLAEKYAHAWESRDLDGFVDLLREDAVYSMPPRPEWYVGRDAIRRFFDRVWSVYGRFHLIETRANNELAFGLYASPRGEEALRPHSLHVLSIKDERIAFLHLFMQPMSAALFSSFGLPSSLDWNVLR